MEQELRFKADDDVLIILTKYPEPDDTTLSLYSYKSHKYGQDGLIVFPVFTDRALFEKTIEGHDFPYYTMEVKFGFLMDMFRGDEHVIVNPATDGEFCFHVADLQMRSS